MRDESNGCQDTILVPGSVALLVNIILEENIVNVLTNYQRIVAIK